MVLEIKPGQSLICQKSAFLAGYGNLELGVHFNKKIGVGLFGGEGFIMQKITGEGIVFLEIDGSTITHQLAAGEKLVVSTGYLVSMSESCQINVEAVKGVKNIFFGGQGLFNTIITGPGVVTTQTMPMYKMANSLGAFMSFNSSSNEAGVLENVTSIINKSMKN